MQYRFFFVTKVTPRIIFTEISCKFIFFTLEIVGLVQWNLKMHFAAQLVIYVLMYNHDNDVVRVFQLITLVGKFMLWTSKSTLLLCMELMHIVWIIVLFFHKSLKL